MASHPKTKSLFRISLPYSQSDTQPTNQPVRTFRLRATDKRRQGNDDDDDAVDIIVIKFTSGADVFRYNPLFICCIYSRDMVVSLKQRGA